MGYNLTIGEAVIEDHGDLEVRVGAEGFEDADAPDHDKYVGKTSSRSPGYSAWSEFCKEAGIEVLFYGSGWDRDARRYGNCPDGYHRETPILAEHPGCQKLCQGDLDVVRAAREKREKNNGCRLAGFWEDDGIDNGTDPTLARLLWLEFWIEYALKHCKIPVIQNT